MVTTFSVDDRRRLAELIGVGEPFLYQCLRGLRNMEAADARAAEEKTGGELRRWHLTKRWHAIWPDLIGSEGAPPVDADDDFAFGAVDDLRCDSPAEQRVGWLSGAGHGRIAQRSACKQMHEHGARLRQRNGLSRDRAIRLIDWRGHQYDEISR